MVINPDNNFPRRNCGEKVYSCRCWRISTG